MQNNNKIAIRKSIVSWPVKAVRAFQTVGDSIKTTRSGSKYERRMSKQQTLQSPAPSFLKINFTDYRRSTRNAQLKCQLRSRCSSVSLSPREHKRYSDPSAIYSVMIHSGNYSHANTSSFVLSHNKKFQRHTLKNGNLLEDFTASGNISLKLIAKMN